MPLLTVKPLIEYLESAKHYKGKVVVRTILLDDGWSIYIEDGDDSYSFMTDLGEREYWPDLMAWKDGVGWVIFEVDGKKGHSTDRDLQKMKLRDKEFLQRGVKTVRLNNDDLVGKKKQPINLILEEIDYQLNRLPTSVSNEANIPII